MRALGLDYGERRIGVAVSDPTGALAQPLETIPVARRGPRSRAHLARIDALAREYEVERIVVGLPLHMDGRAGEQAEAARAFGQEVERRTGRPVEFVDERWTSREAERALAAAGVRAGRQRGRVDRVAAALILRTFLDRECG